MRQQQLPQVEQFVRVRNVQAELFQQRLEIFLGTLLTVEAHFVMGPIADVREC